MCQSIPVILHPCLQTFSCHIKPCASLRDVILIPYTHYHTALGHMQSFSKDTKTTSIRGNGQGNSIKHVQSQVRSTQTNLSEPEDHMSSGDESFDEEDMYPAHYNDESVSDSPDSDSNGESQSPLRELVCPFLYSAIMF